MVGYLETGRDQIQSTAEATSSAGQDDTARVRIFVRLNHLGRQFIEHIAADGVQSLGSVQCNGDHITVLLDQKFVSF